MQEKIFTFVFRFLNQVHYCGTTRKKGHPREGGEEAHYCDTTRQKGPPRELGVEEAHYDYHRFRRRRTHRTPYHLHLHLQAHNHNTNGSQPPYKSTLAHQQTPLGGALMPISAGAVRLSWQWRSTKHKRPFSDTTTTTATTNKTKTKRTLQRNRPPWWRRWSLGFKSQRSTTDTTQSTATTSSPSKTKCHSPVRRRRRRKGQLYASLEGDWSF